MGHSLTLLEISDNTMLYIQVALLSCGAAPFGSRMGIDFSSQPGI